MFEVILERLSNTFDAKGIAYMVIGGQAVLVYGEPRMTKDIDLTVGRDVAALPEILEAVRSLEWKILPEDASAFVNQTRVLPCQDAASGIRIDLIFSNSAYERQAIGRARSISIGKAKIRIAAPEDVIIHKMVAGRPRDIEDVRGILNKSPKLDLQYLRRWLQSFEDALNKPVLKQFDDLCKGGSDSCAGS